MRPATTVGLESLTLKSKLFQTNTNDTKQYNTIEQLIDDTVFQRRLRRNDCSRDIAVGVVLLMSVSIATSTGRTISTRELRNRAAGAQ